jgi:hypothetical protein
MIVALVALAWALSATACGQNEQDEPAVATPSVTLSHAMAPAGSPIEIKYRFVVADAARIDGDYRVMTHIVDADEELMWTDDHRPPVPTTEWKGGQTIEYERTVFVPVFPYVGPASINIGLYRCSAPPACKGPGDQARLPLNGEHVGQRAYRAGRLELLPQAENLFTVFQDGWYQAEVAGGNTGVEWQWTKKEATLAFRNPKKNVPFYLDLDSPGGKLIGPQQVEVSVGSTTIDAFTLQPEQRLLRKMTLPAAQFGTGEMSEIRISVDKTFVPAQVDPNSKDSRELGVRVFHAFVDGR